MMYEPLFDHKFKNIETGKFDTDKLKTIGHSSIANLMAGEYIEWGGQNNHVYRRRLDSYQGLEEAYNAHMIPEREWNIDELQLLDAQTKKEQEERLIAAKQIAELEHKLKALEDEREAFRQYVKEQEAELIRRQKAIAEEEEEVMIYLGGPNSGQKVITSKWNEK